MFANILNAAMLSILTVSSMVATFGTALHGRWGTAAICATASVGLMLSAIETVFRGES